MQLTHYGQKIRPSSEKLKDDLVHFVLSDFLVMPPSETCFQMTKDGNSFFFQDISGDIPYCSRGTCSTQTTLLWTLSSKGCQQEP